MSKIADQLHAVLNDIFPPMPYQRVFKEIYLKYKGQQLFFDFYIKELKTYVEVQGRQHTEYVQHFHGEQENFLRQKQRDNLKIQYIQEEGGCRLIRFNYDETITKQLVMEKLNTVLDGECFYE